MGENAKQKLSRSTILVWSSILLLLLIMGLALDDLGVPGTFSRQLLFFSGVEHTVGWGGESEFGPSVLRPQEPNSSVALATTLVICVVIAIHAMRAFLARTLPTQSAAFFGASVYALMLFSAPPKSGYFAAAAATPLIFLLVNSGSIAFTCGLMCFWTSTAGDQLMPFLVAASCLVLERKQPLFVRVVPLLSFLATVFLLPTARQQLLGGIAAIRSSGIAAELVGWASPDLHQHALGVFIIAALFLLRARSQRSFGRVDCYLLAAIPSYLFCVSTLPFLAAAAAMVVALEASDWERKDGATHPAHWSIVSVVAILSAALAFQLSGIYAPWTETDAVRQLRSQLADEQRKGPLFADIRFGAALLASGLSPFVDSRVEFYSAANPRMVTGNALSDYGELIKLRPQWEEVVDRHRLRVAVLPSNAPLAAVLREKRGWRELGVGGSWEELERGQRKSRYLALLVAPD